MRLLPVSTLVLRCAPISAAALLILLVGLLSSCATSPGAFRNVPRSQPHAVFITEEFDYPFTMKDWESLVHSINGRPVDRPDRRNRYRIPPGTNVIQPGIERSTSTLAPIQFTAVAGRKYVLTPGVVIRRYRLQARDKSFPMKVAVLKVLEYAPSDPKPKVIAMLAIEKDRPL